MRRVESRCGFDVDLITMVARSEVPAGDRIEGVEGHVVVVKTGKELGLDDALNGVIDALVNGWSYPL